LSVRSGVMRRGSPICGQIEHEAFEWPASDPVGVLGSADIAEVWREVWTEPDLVLDHPFEYCAVGATWGAYRSAVFGRGKPLRRLVGQVAGEPPVLLPHDLGELVVQSDDGRLGVRDDADESGALSDPYSLGELAVQSGDRRLRVREAGDESGAV